MGAPGGRTTEPPSPPPPETSLLQGQAWRVGSGLCMILASGSTADVSLSEA